jgi:predicted nucleic acid-binding protein
VADADLVLVDTSVWVKFFREATSLESQVLDMLLAAGPVATCPPIRTEAISGAPTKREYERLRQLFDALTNLELPTGVWRTVEESRFELARYGIQASVVDLLIAVTAHAHHAALWTLDEDFTRIAKVVPMARFHPRAAK